MGDSLSRWLTRTLGCVVLGLVCSACATSGSCKPAKYVRYGDSEKRLDEYELLKKYQLVPATRAWIREADKVIDANNAYGGED